MEAKTTLKIEELNIKLYKHEVEMLQDILQFDKEIIDLVTIKGEFIEPYTDKLKYFLTELKSILED